VLAKQSVEKQTATVGPTHDATVSAMHLLAACYLDAGRFGESISWHEKALEATRDPNILPTNQYARALQGVRRLDEADRVLRKALEVAQTASDRREREMKIVPVQKILALNLLLQERYEDAEPVARQAMAIMDKEMPDHWSRFHAMSLVGGALLGQKRYAEAEPYLVQGYAGMQQREAMINAGFKPLLTQAGDRLVRYFEETNQPEKAREWREKIAKDKNK
jgi:tetratricopeptide (TPR) repeat protein